MSLWKFLSAALCATALAGGISPAARAGSAAVTPVTLTASVSVPSGSTSATGELVTVPAGSRLVIQTVSYFRSNAVAGSVGQLFVSLPSGGYLSTPNALADGAAFPTATIAATGYADAGGAVFVNVYRSGSTSGTENDFVTVSGYYEKD